jgi:hypothetical protein
MNIRNQALCVARRLARSISPAARKAVRKARWERQLYLRAWIGSTDRAAEVRDDEDAWRGGGNRVRSSSTHARQELRLTGLFITPDIHLLFLQRVRSDQKTASYYFMNVSYWLFRMFPASRSWPCPVFSMGRFVWRVPCYLFR